MSGGAEVDRGVLGLGDRFEEPGILKSLPIATEGRGRDDEELKRMRVESTALFGQYQNWCLEHSIFADVDGSVWGVCPFLRIPRCQFPQFHLDQFPTF